MDLVVNRFENPVLLMHVAIAFEHHYLNDLIHLDLYVILIYFLTET